MNWFLDSKRKDKVMILEFAFCFSFFFLAEWCKEVEWKKKELKKVANRVKRLSAIGWNKLGFSFAIVKHWGGLMVSWCRCSQRSKILFRYFFLYQTEIRDFCIAMVEHPSMEFVQGGVMLFISSYFEYVRLRNYLKSQNASFCVIAE